MYRQILLAFDGSHEGRTALAEGIELAALCGAEVHLLSVMEISGSCAFGEGIYALEDVEGNEVSQLSALVNEGLDQIHAHGIKQAHGHIAFGQPVEQISQMAQQISADLIVVGHRNRGLLSRWWQGSLSRQLLDLVRCSVLVSLHPEDEKRL